MIRAARRFTKDVGTCNGCPNRTDEVTCIRMGDPSHSNEIRLCDACLAEFLAESVTQSKTKATHTRSICGVDFDAPKPKPQGVIARKAHSEPHVTKRADVVKRKTKNYNPKPRKQQQRKRVPAQAYPATRLE